MRKTRSQMTGPARSGDVVGGCRQCLEARQETRGQQTLHHGIRVREILQNGEVVVITAGREFRVELPPEHRVHVDRMGER